ncbi:MAG: hypothetical protein KDJ73_13750 [Notoacmeibacter sp.]|nr:hypothetical protein [Notoacmeibacter sp.]MCC0032750.1 hypothetical protein [Brucellaceae bacterium]
MSRTGAVEASRKTEDHVLPVCRGGKITIPACTACNRAKGAKSLPDFLASTHFQATRTKRKSSKAWPEHELFAVYAVAVLRRTHDLMRNCNQAQSAGTEPGALSASG